MSGKRIKSIRRDMKRMAVAYPDVKLVHPRWRRMFGKVQRDIKERTILSHATPEAQPQADDATPPSTNQSHE